MFKGNTTEAMQMPEPQVTSPAHKTEYICLRCGATKFKWVATHGTLRSGGFRMEETVYECLGCGTKVTEDQVRAYFQHF